MFERWRLWRWRCTFCENYFRSTNVANNELKLKILFEFSFLSIYKTTSPTEIRLNTRIVIARMRNHTATIKPANFYFIMAKQTNWPTKLTPSIELRRRGVRLTKMKMAQTLNKHIIIYHNTKNNFYLSDLVAKSTLKNGKNLTAVDFQLNYRKAKH